MSAVTEPESMAELIEDCAEVPRPRVRGREPAPSPREWEVNETCLAQVADLDEYV